VKPIIGRKKGKTEAEIIRLAGFLTLSFDFIKCTVKATKEAAFRDKSKGMVSCG